MRERPRERLKAHGPGALSDAELIALLLGTGYGDENAVEVARRVLSDVGGLEKLMDQGRGRLSRLPGVGEVKAGRILAALELGVRVLEERSRHGTSVRFGSSRDIFDAYRARFGGLKQEVFMVVGLNNKNGPISEHTVAKGSVNECQVAPREVFRPLIAEAASRAVVIHNHPSQDPTPSAHDAALTRRLARVAELIGIPLLDHVIITRFQYASLRDLGLF
jgi:DNA repair protein RadC